MDLVYVIIQCPKCHQYTMAKGGQKTRTCPYCRARITIATHIIKRGLTAKSAVELVKYYNEKHGESRLNKWFNE